MIIKAYALIDKALNVKKGDEKLLLDIYDELGFVLKHLSNIDLRYLNENISRSRQNSVELYSRGYAGKDEELRKIEVYDQVLSLVANAQLATEDELEF